MERPIGVIDSGIGGLTVTHELIHQLPNESIIYLGDSKRCPYGPRPIHEVKEFTWEMVNYLLDKNIKVLVLACNTITAIAKHELEAKLNIPVIGVIQPGAEAAAAQTKSNVVGVIGTEGTIKSQMYSHALYKINSNITVHELACPRFVPLIEKGYLTGDKITSIVEHAFLPFREKNSIDTLVLGCTHYPFIASTIQKSIGEQVTLVTSSIAVTEEVRTILKTKKISNQMKKASHYFLTTGNLKDFKKLANRLFIGKFNIVQSIVLNKIAI